MAQEYIAAVIVEFARVLKPAAYLMRWTDKYVLCEGRHLGIAPDLFKIVDLIATDNERIGMGLSHALSRRFPIGDAKAAGQGACNLVRSWNPRSLDRES